MALLMKINVHFGAPFQPARNKKSESTSSHLPIIFFNALPKTVTKLYIEVSQGFNFQTSLKKLLLFRFPLLWCWIVSEIYSVSLLYPTLDISRHEKEHFILIYLNFSHKNDSEKKVSLGKSFSALVWTSKQNGEWAGSFFGLLYLVAPLTIDVFVCNGKHTMAHEITHENLP